MASRFLSDSGSVESDYFMDEDESTGGREESMGFLFREESQRSSEQLKDAKPTDESAFEPLTMENIVEEQRKLIEQVMEITELPSHMARTFLQQMKWDKNRLTEAYYDDRDRALAKAGLAVKGDAVGAVELTERSLSDSRMQVVQDTVTCQVCLEDFAGAAVREGMVAMPHCGHMFCNGCWQNHLRSQIMKEGEAERIHCPGCTELDGKTVPCNILMDERVVESLLTASSDPEFPEILSKYRKRLIDSYVNSNPNIKWCPGTDCTSAVRITDAMDLQGFVTQVRCPAGHEFCFLCNDEAHGPAECDLAKMWKKKCMDDSETCNWLQVNTKDCPNCKVAINKDGGCNHMHCRRCDTHFCWLCLDSFKNYSHTCNKFVENQAQASNSRAALERYMFHYERFMAHANSSKLEHKVVEQCVLKMQEMQDAGHKSYMEVLFMKEATDRLMLSRRVLKWTYVVCFYEPKWVNKNILENNQAELEHATEQLSGMVEGNDDFMKWCESNEKIRMMDQTQKVAMLTGALFNILTESKQAALEAGMPIGAAAIGWSGTLPTDNPSGPAPS